MQLLFHFHACKDGCRVVVGVVGDEALPGELLVQVEGAVPRVIPAPRIIGVGAAHEVLVVAELGENSDVVLTLILAKKMKQVSWRAWRTLSAKTRGISRGDKSDSSLRNSSTLEAQNPIAQETL